MKKGLLAPLVFALALCFALVGCGGSGGGDPKANFVGTWSLESLEASDSSESVSAEDMELMRALGMDVVVTLSEDGSFDFDMFGEVFSGTWDATSADKAGLTLEGDTVEATLAGDKLTIEIEGDALIFTKTGDAPAAAATTTSTSAPAASAGDVVYESDLVAVEFVRAEIDDWGDPALYFNITNKTSDQTLYAWCVSGTWEIGGQSIDPDTGLSYDVEPGQTLEDFMWFDGETVGSDEALLDTISGTIAICDSSTYDTLETFDFSM